MLLYEANGGGNKMSKKAYFNSDERLNTMLSDSQEIRSYMSILGAYFLDIYSDKNGNIQYFEPEEILFSKNDIWDEVGKDKRKVKKLEIKNGKY